MILTVLQSIFWLLVALLILVTIHEYGHYWVARRFGVGIRRFSVGFGKPIWMRVGADGTEYALAMIPLGGYVSMVDEREAPVRPSERETAFNRKPVGQRIAIVAAGPIVNLLFAVFAFWLMFMIGVEENRMLLGDTHGVAAESGLVRGDRIIAIDGDEVETVQHSIITLMPHALDRLDIPVTVESSSGAIRTELLRFSQLPDDFSEERLIEQAGLALYRPRLTPVIAEVAADTPAERAGLKADDRIVRINDTPIETQTQVSSTIMTEGEGGAPLVIEVDRAGQRLQFELLPELTEIEGDTRLRIGILQKNSQDVLLDPEDYNRFFTIMQYGPVESIGKAFAEMKLMTVGTYQLISRMITGVASTRNLSGAITIADFSRQSADLGLARFLAFLALLSLSLGILNLLPIPLLDGGHLLYYFVELIKGSPVSENIQIAGQYVGLLIIGFLLTLTFYNDILRLVS